MQEINLYDLIKFYVRKWRFIAILIVAGLAGGFVYNTFIQVALYESSSKLILVSSPTSSPASNQTLINNYIDLITSRRLLEPVVVKQNKSISYEELLKEVKAINQKDTAVINVKVTTTNAKQSTDISNEITESFTLAVNELYQTSGVIVVDPAVQPASPSNVYKGLQLSISTGVGFALSLIALFFVYDYSGGKVKKTIIRTTAKKSTKTIKKKLFPTKILARFIAKPIQKKAVKKTLKAPVLKKSPVKKPIVTDKKSQKIIPTKLKTIKNKKS